MCHSSINDNSVREVDIYSWTGPNFQCLGAEWGAAGGPSHIEDLLYDTFVSTFLIGFQPPKPFRKLLDCLTTILK